MGSRIMRSRISSRGVMVVGRVDMGRRRDLGVVGKDKGGMEGSLLCVFVLFFVFVVLLY